jgi:hypothetical protein
MPLASQQESCCKATRIITERFLLRFRGVTNVPVAVAEKNREFVPVGVKSDVTKGEETASGNSNTAPKDSLKGTVNLTSTPAGAAVVVDGTFTANAPATLKLVPGKHTITVKMSGQKDWTRELNVEAGSEVQLAATLDKAE